MTSKNPVFLLFLLFSFFIGSKHVSAQSKVLPKELRVAQDGSGDYKTIQEAVNAVRDLGQLRVKIFIAKGIYHEKLIIPSWKTAISLIGADPRTTIITNSDYSGKPMPGATRDMFGNDKFSTYTSFTVLVQGNDFYAENLTFENGSGKVGQAVALHAEGDRIVLKNCRLLGNQDTLYAAKEGARQFYQDCYIEGTTDFIFGEATAVFEKCTIKSLVDSYVTAASTRAGSKFGFVFLNCKLTADGNATKVYLGRPWRPFAKTVFIKCEMENHILPVGWDPWKGDSMFPDKEKTTFYAEFESIGKGAKVENRAGWSKQLSPAEASQYTVGNILSAGDNWNPLSVK